MDNSLYEQIKIDYITKCRDRSLSPKEKTNAIITFVVKYITHKEELIAACEFYYKTQRRGCLYSGFMGAPGCSAARCLDCIRKGKQLDYIMTQINKPR